MFQSTSSEPRVMPRQMGPVTFVQLAAESYGSLDVERLQELDRACRPLIGQVGTRNVFIDLTPSRHYGAALLNLLMRLQCDCAEHQQGVVVTGDRHGLLAITRLNTRIVTSERP